MTADKLGSILLPPAFAGGIPRYALMARAQKTTVFDGLRYDKRFKSTHRCVVAATRGKLTLTVPLISAAVVAQGLDRTLRWTDMHVSDHGNWRAVMMTSLASAYGRTPFFEFYADRFDEIIRRAVEGSRLVDLSRDMETEICRILAIPTPVFADEPDPQARDLTRREIAGVVPQYWQVRQDSLGFLDSLSILDLIFNLGPEAQLLLDRVEVNL